MTRRAVCWSDGRGVGNQNIDFGFLHLGILVQGFMLGNISLGVKYTDHSNQLSV